jgi:hypothetical protein
LTTGNPNVQLRPVLVNAVMAVKSSPMVWDTGGGGGLGTGGGVTLQLSVGQRTADWASAGPAAAPKRQRP